MCIRDRHPHFMPNPGMPLPGEMQAMEHLGRRPEVEQELPRADEYMDLKTKIISTEHEDGRVGSGCRRQVMLWRKYGERQMAIGANNEERVERRYFKCTQPGCQARLRADCRLSAGDQMAITAIGSHNHMIQIAPSSLTYKPYRNVQTPQLSE
eukprot:TRINITY_DN27338_c0_g1_i1.p1 TRINITY_DN27338_c0_g1~~TRINITY_DN27338_c0_g1_i1.p1  ORF type:complete len:153 (-),score=26.64 TRINITY_DN27338_c0_g1_i1:241-699(-)